MYRKGLDAQPVNDSKIDFNNSCPSLYEINKLTSKNFEVKDLPFTNFSDAKKDATFKINFTVCDFYLLKNKIVLILRRDIKFYFAKYNLENLKLEKETPIEGFTTENLSRWPTFSHDGKIIILRKASEKIQFVSYDL